ncbi:hypothetical protein GMO_15430 [Gluconobacter morbifer G707]|uniref:Uncharacterized protein n=1 Tax=Gluconobacter morbifer G707 TaxID=1088869 RepID=G6XJ77_9PROT|nr:hypothetical protein GMO_15430 [Gluconobacter morbifer G707]
MKIRSMIVMFSSFRSGKPAFVFPADERLLSRLAHPARQAAS